MQRTVSVVLVGLCLVGVGSTNVWAQATAQISGTVTDATGALMPGVEITATQTGTGNTRNAVTNETGIYVLPNLPIGPYRLEAALPGFQSYVQSGIVLQVGSNAAVNIVLQVGQVAQTIEVQANAALVETRSVGVGQVIENERILELPLNGRAVVELVSLAGGTAPSRTIGGSDRDPFNQGNVSIAGGLNSGVNFTLDGADHNNPYLGSYLSMPFPDAMQEFKVESGATSAKGGVKSSGTVSLVTKSGTNEFHGNAFEFVRNGAFNARNAFAPRRDTMKRNQFGGTIGGPIIGRKLFFFAGYQGTRIRQDAVEQFQFVPTAAIRAGDFRVFASPVCNAGRQITLRAPFVDNQVNPTLFSAPAVKFASHLPTPSDPCGRTIYSNPLIDDWNDLIGRVDYQLNNNHSLFGRYLRESRVQPTGYDLNKNLLSINNGIDGVNQSFAVGSTYLFGAKTVNTFRFSANRMDGGKTGPDFTGCDCGNGKIGIKSYFPLPEEPSISVSGAFSVGTSRGPTTMKSQSFNDDLSIIRGNHQLAFGMAASFWRIDSASTANQRGTFTFNGQSYGLGMADYFLGRAATFRIGSAFGQENRSKYFNVYAGDTWQPVPRVTLNYGIRWEPYFPQTNLDGSSIHYDENALRQGIRTKRFDNAPPGLFFDGDPGFPDGTGMYNQWRNISPRLGVAWNVTGDGRTSLRASVGTFYDFPTAQYQKSLTNVAPFSQRLTLSGVDFVDPWTGYPGGDPGELPFGKNVPRNVDWPLDTFVTAMDYDTPNMRVGQWNLSVQRQLGTNWIVSANYIGTATRHLWGTQPINPVIFIAGVGDASGNCRLNGQIVPFKVNAGAPCSAATTASYSARRKLALDPSIPRQVSEKLGHINRIDSGGTASYNGLVLSVERRPAKGMSINANYTWSHCITDPWLDSAQAANFDAGWQDPKNRRLDRGNCSTGAQDRRHVFNLSGVATTPQFSSSAARILASGWRFSPILRILSGSYLTVTTGRDTALTLWGGQRPDLVMANPYGDRSIQNYLNPQAFALPATGALGNVGMATIEGPGTWQFDISLARTFRVTEAQRIEFRAEAFNVTNSFRMNDPATSLNSNTFGQVNSSRDPRIMQFALKYFF